MVTGSLRIGFVVALALVAGSAAAQLRPQYRYPEIARDDTSRAAIQLGDSPLYAAPMISAAIGQDSNVTNASSGERDTTYQLYGADLILDARSNRSVFVWDLSVARGIYNDSRNDNYTDSGSRMGYDIAFDTRNFVHLGWDYIRGHEGRGTTDRGLSLYPDKFFFNGVGGTYSYGATGAQGRIELYGSRGEKRYLNNPESTFASNRNLKEFGGVFYWRVAPKTYALVEGRGDGIHYLDTTSGLSSHETRLYIGATWEATAATTGTIKLGQLQKRFDQSGQKFQEFAYEAQIDWAPRPYSNFSFFAVRTPTESTGLGDFILSDIASAVWTHQWNSRFMTTAAVRYQRDRYQGFDRDDDTTTLGLKAYYKFRRWVTFGASYLYVTRDSSVSNFNFDRNIWLLSADLSL
jgi:hypothetical protein